MFFSVINIMTFLAKCFNLCLLLSLLSFHNVKNQLCMPGYPCDNNGHIDDGNRHVNKGEQNLLIRTDWVKVFQHNSKNRKFFANREDALNRNPNNPNAQLYSILYKLEDYRSSDGRFKFKLCYPELNFGAGGKKCNIWYQSSNPALSDTITGFEAIDLAYKKDSYGKPWRGLGRTCRNTTLIDDAPKKHYWHSAIGVCSNVFVDRFPGPLEVPFGSYPQLVEMYVEN